MSRRRHRKTPSPGTKSAWDLLHPTLDLHGRTAAEAEREAESWLGAKHAEGESTVRLITGRGMHSAGPAVLPATIEELLRRLRGSTVKSYEREPGGGAYRVRLSRRFDPAPPRVPVAPAGVRNEDPELVREALDALDELGIQPTPVLIQAEIRRIVKKRRHEAD